MALQLLKRNYTMGGYEAPKILKLPQGEMRWAPRRLPVDVGDVMMNVRMDDGKNRYIGENISKYAQGINPYGEFGYPYKINKSFRPPIIDPKYYEALSRMPVKFDSVTAGPIVKDLYGKQVEINAVAPPKTITDKVCAQVAPKPSAQKNTQNGYQEGNIALHIKQPHASIPYHPSMPVHLNTGVPEIELDSKIIARPNMGIHAPYQVSDQSRDVLNMRTPMHVALRPGYKDPYTMIQLVPNDSNDATRQITNVAASAGYNPGFTLNTNIDQLFLEPALQVAANTNIVAPVPTIDNITRSGLDLAPKVQTSAWYNPSYDLAPNNAGFTINPDANKCLNDRVNVAVSSKPTQNRTTINQLQDTTKWIDDTKVKTAASARANYKLVGNQGPDQSVEYSTRFTPLHFSQMSNVNSALLKNGELGQVELEDALALGEFAGKQAIPSIDDHQTFSRARERDGISMNNQYYQNQTGLPMNAPHASESRQAGIRTRLNMEQAPVNRTGVEPNERIVPVGTARFVYSQI